MDVYLIKTLFPQEAQYQFSTTLAPLKIKAISFQNMVFMEQRQMLLNLFQHFPSFNFGCGSIHISPPLFLSKEMGQNYFQSPSGILWLPKIVTGDIHCPSTLLLQHSIFCIQDAMTENTGQSFRISNMSLLPHPPPLTLEE